MRNSARSEWRKIGLFEEGRMVGLIRCSGDGEHAVNIKIQTKITEAFGSPRRRGQKTNPV